MGEAEARLAPHREQIALCLAANESEERGLRLSKVHQLLERQGVEVPYRSLHRFAVRHCGFHDRRRGTVRLADVAPGELAEVDFGKLGLAPERDREGRPAHRVYALLVTLVQSRHQYVHVTTAQLIADLIDGIEANWRSCGTRRASRTSSATSSTCPRASSAARHGSTSRTCSAPPSAGAWRCGARVHGTTRQRPLAVFEDVERAALRPLAGERFDTQGGLDFLPPEVAIESGDVVVLLGSHASLEAATARLSPPIADREVPA